MKKKMKFTLVTFLIVCFGAIAQNVVQVRDQHYKKRIVKAIDLREKQNKPLYASNMDLSSKLLEAVKNGSLKAYKNDSLNSEMTYEDMRSILLISEAFIAEEPMFPNIDYDSSSNSEAYYFEGRDLYQLEMTQDWVFDKQKSVVNKQNVALTLYVPADHLDNVRGYQMPVASFKFADCQAIWKDDPKAIWFNPQNDAAHLNLSDAFRLELYHSYLIKISNPDDAEIADGLTGKEGIIESGRKEMELAEYESNLWEN